MCLRFPAARPWTATRCAPPTRAAPPAPSRARFGKSRTLYTGQVSPIPVREGECIEIATGAPMPDGADAVVMVEETDCDADGSVRVFIEVQPQQNVGRRGADIQAGQIVLAAGETLNSSRIGALAAVGTAIVEVYERPRVAILSTGNEVVEPGQPLKPGQIYDINRFTLSAVVSEHGGIARPGTRRRPIRWTRSVPPLEHCLANDIVVFSGGSSVGERDLMSTPSRRKVNCCFHGISVKPGKPTGFGMVNGKPVFAMPGYPASCLTNAHILLVPLLRRMARLGPKVTRTVRVPLSQRVASAPNRHQFYTVRIVDGTAVPAFKASGDITSMSQADGYIEIPADVETVERGSLVDVTLF